MDITNKVIWVTGASSGIGEALVYELAKRNCKLILSARREAELQRVKENTNLPDEQILILPIDLEQFKNAQTWVDKVVEKFSTIDILINNGGISQKSLAMETIEAVEQKFWNINYFGNVALSKAVLPIMQQKKYGKVVVITSILGKFGLPQLSTYAATKHALYGFYESLRLELVKDNVSVLLAAPGFINTQVSVNAIDGEGNITNENSDAQLNGMKPDIFAKNLVNAIVKDKQHVYIGKKELLTIPFKTLFPKLFYKIMLKLSNKK
ncbi:MAG: short chain dehydrogenase [Flavobacteriales bacterium]|jgi:short-subunit dehydrogenase|nr:short chain dehydrogenase [Flavobacteriales bacterium]|tara:strand:- start:79388 stop:80185 length:798 start_codon:yes stop_codon:yes gene_type:complete